MRKLTLTPQQADYLRSQPVPAGESNRLTLALRIAGARKGDLAEALRLANGQLTRYFNGGDMHLSRATAIADVFGVTVSDLFPATAKRRTRKAA